MNTARLCSVPGCGKKHWAKGYCVNHYMQKRRSGSVKLAPAVKPDPLQRVSVRVPRNVRAAIIRYPEGARAALIRWAADVLSK